MRNFKLVFIMDSYKLVNHMVYNYDKYFLLHILNKMVLTS